MKKAILLLMTLTSCQVYRNHFDCPPGQGVPCTSVTEIESMVIETPEGGPDLFDPSLPRQKIYYSQTQTIPSYNERVWVRGECTPFGNYVGGHYLYFSDEGECCECSE